MPGAGGDRRVPGRKRVLCFAVASRFCFPSLDCKKLLWRPAHPGWGCTCTQRSPGCQARRRRSAPEKARAGWAAGSRWLQVMRFSFFLFFLSFFFFFSISLKYLQQWGRRRRREEGVRGPPRERSKPRTHSPGRSRPKICSPDSRAHRTGNCPDMATPVGWGPCGELCFIRSHPKGGGHWVHLRAEGAGLLGRQGKEQKKGASENVPPLNHQPQLPILLTLGLSARPEATVSREQGAIVQEEPVHLSFCSHCSLWVQLAAFLATERSS